MTRIVADSPIAAIADILRNAAFFGRSAWQSAHATGANDMPDPGDLASRVEAFFRLLHQRSIAYLLVGGVAMLRYVEGRNTEDLDLILSVESLKDVPELSLTDQKPHFARGKFGDLRIDLLFTDNPLFQLVQTQYATTHRFQELDVRMATVEGLMLLKLYALPSLYRQGDGQRIAIYEADIMMLRQQYQPEMAPLLVLLGQFVDPTALEELRNIVRDIDARIARIEASRKK